VAEYRVTVTGEPWVVRSGYVVFAVEIERPDGVGGWVAVRDALSELRVPLHEVRTALQDPQPLLALGAVVVAHAQADEAVEMDSRIAPYRGNMPEWPVTLEFEV
jgi:hypothetical protein